MLEGDGRAFSFPAAHPSVQVKDLLAGLDDLGRSGLRELLQVLCVRHGHIRLGDPEHWRVQVVERLALDVVYDLGAESSEE